MAHRDRERHPRRFESAPYLVEDYVALKTSSDRPYIDGVRYAHILGYQAGTQWFPQGFHFESANRKWGSRWRHCGGRMAGGVDALHEGNFDQPYVRCAEEVYYLRTLKYLLEDNARVANPTLADFFAQFGPYFNLCRHNGEQFGREFYDEDRYRERYGLFAGWHNVELHSLFNQSRDDLFWKTPEHWVQEFEVSPRADSRLLAVQNPPVTMYCFDIRRQLADADPLARLLDRMVIYEYVQGFVIAHASTAKYGCFYSDLLDHRYLRASPTAGPLKGRIFHLPVGVLRTLHEVHPFFFLESNGLDPVLGFLALRRGQEYRWGTSVCAPYDFNSGTFASLGADIMLFRSRNRRGGAAPLPAVVP